jgi:DNA-binding NtrC family response regulator
MSAIEVLVVDDEKGVRDLLKHMLERKGYAVQCVASAELALKANQKKAFGLVITDLRLPGMLGEALLVELKRQRPALPVVVISAYGGTRSVVEVIKSGAEDYLAKPFTEEDLDIVVFKALQKHRLLLENERLRSELSQGAEPLLGQSALMRRLRQDLQKLAQGRGPVLVSGESGTGKELAARALHTQSPRAKGPFIEVNAGAIPAGLFEAEFFGNRKGAFTGAGEEREGLFRAAEGGTLFLDEVGEVPLDLQAKLLRALEAGAVRPVGADRPVPVDVRVVAATNQDLAALVDKGRFRRDLYFRLSALPVKMPSLREHGEDIPLLAEHFLRQLSAAKHHFNAAALRALQAHAWPGNVRELRNCVERALIFAESDEIGLAELPFLAREAPLRPQGALKQAKKQQAEAFERRYLEQALRQHAGNVSKAAAEAGLDRRNFQALLKRYELRAADFKVPLA